MNKTNIAEILNKFDLRESDFQRIRAVTPLLKRHLDSFIADFYAWMAQHQEYQVFFASNPARLERVKQLQRVTWLSLLEAHVDEAWFDARRHIGAVHAHIDLPNDIYFAAVSVSNSLLSNRLRQSKAEVKDLDATIDSLSKLLFLDAYVVVDEIARINREKIAASSKALMEMSTPVTPIWEGILLLPLLGLLDSQRTQDVMNKTLSRIAETRAKVFVMDISGVSAMDTAVANQLLKITKATQLMGCETILSGLSPAIARTLVELGVNIGEVRTTATLRDSFELALRAVGVDTRRLAGAAD
jgi:rsbT co-antagonist protein RsbR